MRKGWRAITSGAAASLVMAVLILMLDVQTRARFSLFEALARLFMVPGNVALGFLIFLAFGVVGWPLLFAVLEPRTPLADDPVISGMLFATLLWGGFVVLGTTDLNLLFLPFYLVTTLFTHLAYGFTLGLVYAWTPLQSDVERRNPHPES